MSFPTGYLGPLTCRRGSEKVTIRIGYLGALTCCRDVYIACMLHILTIIRIGYRSPVDGRVGVNLVPLPACFAPPKNIRVSVGRAYFGIRLLCVTKIEILSNGIEKMSLKRSLRFTSYYHRTAAVLVVYESEGVYRKHRCIEI